MKKNIITAVLCGAMIAGTIPAAGAANTVTATPTRDMGQTVYVDGARIYPTGYNIADNNYFKLRDLGAALDFGVTWDNGTRTVAIDTDAPYAAE